MDKEYFSKRIKELSNEIGILLKEEQIEKFYIYMQLLIDWNEKVNLTAIVEPEEIILKHFIDSITIAKNIDKNTKLIDVGTGAGFPGIPLKIIREDIDVCLLDSLNKRINFLNEVVSKLKLNKIEAIHGRAEELGRNKKYREKFDYATSRAVANLATLSEYLMPFIKENGYCISMKGNSIEEELEQGKKAISILGGEVREIQRFQLPQSDINRCVVMINKVKTTPAKYPRKSGTPAKEPIK